MYFWTFRLLGHCARDERGVGNGIGGHGRAGGYLPRGVSVWFYLVPTYTLQYLIAVRWWQLEVGGGKLVAQLGPVQKKGHVKKGLLFSIQATAVSAGTFPIISLIASLIVFLISLLLELARGLELRELVSGLFSDPVPDPVPDPVFWSVFCSRLNWPAGSSSHRIEVARGLELCELVRGLFSDWFFCLN